MIWNISIFICYLIYGPPVPSYGPSYATHISLCDHRFYYIVILVTCPYICIRFQHCIYYCMIMRCKLPQIEHVDKLLFIERHSCLVLQLLLSTKRLKIPKG